MHKSAMSFDSGLKLKDLTKFIFISLDDFLKMRHNIDKDNSEGPALKGLTFESRTISMLDAWLLLLSSDNPGDIYAILKKSPVFGEIYRDIVNFQFQPKELIGMYSETLKLMDQNMIKFMIDEQKEKLEKQNGMIAEQKGTIAKQCETIARHEATISEQTAVIAELKQRLKESQNK